MKFFNNRFIDALAKTVLIFASIHIFALFIYSLATKSLEPLNLFYILQLHIFFPEIVKGAGWFIIGMIVTIAVYGVVYAHLLKDKE